MTAPTQGPNAKVLLTMSIKLITFDLDDTLWETAPAIVSAEAKLREWLAAGRIRSHEDMVDGFAAFPRALGRMFEGANTGKMLLRLRDDAAVA